MPAVDVYLGLGSRYSYLAFTQLARIEAATGARFNLIPVSSVELMALRGASPFAGAPVSGQYDWDYRQRDAEDWAAYYDVPYVEPSGLRDDHQLLARACIAAGQQGQLRAYMAALFGAIFGGNVPRSPADCVQIAQVCGLDPGQFTEALEATSTGEQVTRNATQAVARGAFGVPTFFLGNRMFWGNDRLVLLEAALGSKGGRA